MGSSVSFENELNPCHIVSPWCLLRHILIRSPAAFSEAVWKQFLDILLDMKKIHLVDKATFVCSKALRSTVQLLSKKRKSAQVAGE